MKKIAFVGASIRASAFVNNLRKNFAAEYELAAVMDIDPGKIKGFKAVYGVENAAEYTDFDKMCDEIAPDMLIISSMDSTHADYVVKALDRKIACVSEKPLCINQQQCRDILDAQARNPEIFAATSHNSRYLPLTLKMKELIDSGVIGKVMRMEYAELLDRVHGKSYFRRWNSRRKYSNGLQLHKSSHHFDKMNFLLNSFAVEVIASGTLTAYGNKVPHKYEGINCHTCQYAKECPDYRDYNHAVFTSDEIYTPDMCIYSPDIDIEDNYAAVITFANGVMCSYSLCAHANYEGEIIMVEGETGRLEAYHTYCREVTVNEDNVHDDKLVFSESLRLFRFRQPGYEEIEIPQADGGHGGADPAVMKDIFSDPPSPQTPTLMDGVQAVLTGCALVESMKSGKKCMVQDLLKK